MHRHILHIYVQSKEKSTNTAGIKHRCKCITNFTHRGKSPRIIVAVQKRKTCCMCTNTHKKINKVFWWYSLLSIAYSRGDWSRGQHHGLTAQPLKYRQRSHGLRQCLWSTSLSVAARNTLLHARKISPQTVFRVHKSAAE